MPSSGSWCAACFAPLSARSLTRIAQRLPHITRPLLPFAGRNRGQHLLSHSRACGGVALPNLLGIQLKVCSPASTAPAPAPDRSCIFRICACAALVSETKALCSPQRCAAPQVWVTLRVPRLHAAASFLDCAPLTTSPPPLPPSPRLRLNHHRRLC